MPRYLPSLVVHWSAVHGGHGTAGLCDEKALPFTAMTWSTESPRLIPPRGRAA